MFWGVLTDLLACMVAALPILPIIAMRSRCSNGKVSVLLRVNSFLEKSWMDLVVLMIISSPNFGETAWLSASSSGGLVCESDSRRDGSFLRLMEC